MGVNDILGFVVAMFMVTVMGWHAYEQHKIRLALEKLADEFTRLEK